MSLKFTNLRLLSNLPGANELTTLGLEGHYTKTSCLERWIEMHFIYLFIYIFFFLVSAFENVICKAILWSSLNSWTQFILCCS